MVSVPNLDEVADEPAPDFGASTISAVIATAGPPINLAGLVPTLSVAPGAGALARPTADPSLVGSETGAVDAPLTVAFEKEAGSTLEVPARPCGSDSGVDVLATLAPRGADLLAAVLPLDRDAIEASVSRFLAQFEGEGAEVGGDTDVRWPRWVVVGAGGLALEVARRWRERGESARPGGPSRRRRSALHGLS